MQRYTAKAWVSEPMLFESLETLELLLEFHIVPMAKLVPVLLSPSPRLPLNKLSLLWSHLHNAFSYLICSEQIQKTEH